MKLTPSLLALGLLGWTLATSAQTSTPEVVVPVGGTVTIPAPGFQKSQVLLPDKADFEIQPDGIRVRGKEVGQTKVVVWDQQGPQGRRGLP